MATVPGVGIAAPPGMAVAQELLLFCADGPPSSGAMYWPCVGLGAFCATARPPVAPRMAALVNKVLRIVSLLYSPASSVRRWSRPSFNDPPRHLSLSQGDGSL